MKAVALAGFLLIRAFFPLNGAVSLCLLGAGVADLLLSPARAFSLI